ncbi:hypothetical protein AC1031_005109 [Aphanomyces cochlioides]|nr:hypothetical protein AC1031_005109 [Aphanomyces cochlioides]
MAVASTLEPIEGLTGHDPTASAWRKAINWLGQTRDEAAVAVLVRQRQTAMSNQRCGHDCVWRQVCSSHVEIPSERVAGRRLSFLIFPRHPAMGVQKQTKSPLLQINVKWLSKKQQQLPESDAKPYAEQLKQIKEILKDHDTQNNLLPLKFHRYIKPPVHPPKRLLVAKEVVGGKPIPFTKTMVKKVRAAHQAKVTNDAMKLRPIYEDDAVAVMYRSTAFA